MAHTQDGKGHGNDKKWDVAGWVGHRGGGVPIDMSQRRVMSVVGSGIRWRSSEVKAAAVPLSSSRCAAARV